MRGNNILNPYDFVVNYITIPKCHAEILVRKRCGKGKKDLLFCKSYFTFSIVFCKIHNMVVRPFWLNQLEDAWKLRPLIWLSGVRRIGKTTLCKMLPEASYMNCDLPSVSRQLENPEYLFGNLAPGTTLILDEVHRIKDPSRLLKIGVDEFPQIKVLATGSSTLAATKKFRDTLTGRKIQLHLPPVLWSECLNVFNLKDLDRRLLHGGLPELLLNEHKDADFYSEWIDSFYARDIQELFRVRNRTGFLKLTELLFMQSGGLLEISSIARDSALTRPTVMTHLEALSAAHAIRLVQPYSSRRQKEIVKRPKVYAFDTGFVTYVKGWNEIRETDRGLLWEHLVLDMLSVENRPVRYWQDKDKTEIDFVIPDQDNNIHAVECKVNPDKYSPKALQKFRTHYPGGKNMCYSPHIKTPYKLSFGDMIVEFRASPEKEHTK
jgi:predicted AAA+ superfamily ATPase